MAVMHAARAIGLALGIEAEDDVHDLAPVGSFFCGVQQAELGREVTLVIGRHVRRVRGMVIEGGDGHRHARPPSHIVYRTFLLWADDGQGVIHYLAGGLGIRIVGAVGSTDPTA